MKRGMENNSEELKKIVLECNGQYQGKKYDVPIEIYCPIIPIMCGKGLCKYQSNETTKIVENDGGKNYKIPRYLCLWRKF